MCCLVSLLAMTGHCARGGSIGWDNGAGTGLWGDATNWAPDGVPGASDNVVLNSAATIDLGGVERMVNSLSLTVSKRVDITNGTLRLAGSDALGHTFYAARGDLVVNGSIVIGDATGNAPLTAVLGAETPSQYFWVAGGIAKATAGQAVKVQLEGYGYTEFFLNNSRAVTHDETLINSGMLRLYHSDGGSFQFGLGAIALNGGNLNVNSANAVSTLTNPIRIESRGGALFRQGTAIPVVYTGEVTLAGNLDIRGGGNGGPGGGATLILAGTMRIVGGDRTITAWRASGDVTRITGNIVEDQPGRKVTFANIGATDLIVAGSANNWTGGTVIAGGWTASDQFVEVSAGSMLGSGPVEVASDGRLRIAGALSPGTDVIVRTDGALETVSSVNMRTLKVDGGIVSVKSAVLTVGDGLVASPLTTTNPGKINLESGMVVDCSAVDRAAAYAKVRLAIIEGYHNVSGAPGMGDWLGAGITSSAAAAAPSLRGIGYASTEADTTFMGVNVDGSAILVRRTLLGDVNLDGQVNFFDLTALAASYGGPGDWQNGDFNYDGQINFYDLTSLAANYGSSGSFSSDWSAAMDAVPEPSVAICLIAFAAMLGRRARRE